MNYYELSQTASTTCAAISASLLLANYEKACISYKEEMQKTRSLSEFFNGKASTQIAHKRDRVKYYKQEIVEFLSKGFQSEYEQ